MDISTRPTYIKPTHPESTPFAPQLLEPTLALLLGDVRLGVRDREIDRGMDTRGIQDD
jgi:hypothetical protein